MAVTLDKGMSMEERVRSYFMKSGYYTLRGVPFTYGKFDVTDIDLWLYDRPSPVSRHRVVVDIKNKKTPQAIERIFWAKGLAATLRLDQAIVATTDKRPDVAQFGREHGVVVLDGNFLSRLANLSLSGRMSEEDFLHAIDAFSDQKVAGDWKGRLRTAKSLVLNGLGYNEVNSWLTDARFFAEQTLIVPLHKTTACRILYLIASLVAVGFDFVMRDLAFVEQDAKVTEINSGLQFGSSGARGTAHVIDIAIGLVDQYAPEMRGLGSKIRRGVESDLEDVQTHIPAEYFARPSTAQGLYNIARELEEAAYLQTFKSPSDLSVDARSMLSVLLDFWAIDRGRFFSNMKSEANGKPERGNAPSPMPNRLL
ncbi:hypothetical protein [Rhizobium indigoferae]|uniref:Restriction endonuclease type IV Mrr domain-containing protein n=1 Tax=Rhizobium indigoferae TaxID=158891 RepID=A0ABZ0ZL24_9HYPH|nr:hypothetical protein [Rhizobium indigoferae]NNU57598.1 hypothetical protein [Rhizobium indigoferae]WQN39522.1 hypothetical protein U5G49_004726 [Rhizobium indigoferae]GLR60801.1 hypothetical protein GCM10007919_55300 [Rhizobium indigoferae]